MRSVLAGGFVLGWIAALAAWMAAVVRAVLVVRNVQPGVSLWSRRVGYNPANVLFHPELLTPEGLAHLRRLRRVVAVFGALVAGTLALGALSGEL